MTGRHVSVALDDTDLTRAIVQGSVSVEGLAVTPLVVATEERHDRMARSREFDVCEFSISQYLALRERGDAGFTAIPVFPRRMFLQRFLFCRPDAGIAKPEDLAGARVVISRYQNSLALWLRGFLEHEHGVPPGAVDWVALRGEAMDFDLPAGIRLRRAPDGSTVENLLAAGEAEAAMVPWTPQGFQDGAPFIRRLFRDVKAAEVEYYRRTRDFPILHTVVVRDDVLHEAPWAADAVRALFEQAKRRYAEYASHPARLGQPFGSLGREEELALMGADPWPYNVSDNLPSLRRLVQYAREQGLTTGRLDVEGLFHR